MVENCWRFASSTNGSKHLQNQLSYYSTRKGKKESILSHILPLQSVLILRLLYDILPGKEDREERTPVDRRKERRRAKTKG